jgi:RNA polymerase sigma-70 factor (ECF subfamily)
MATSVIPRPRPALTAAQAVALTMLRDGYTQRTITIRTGTEPTDLYRLAALHDISAPHGTVEGHNCHEARDDEPCTGCTHAHGRAHAREHAQRRRTIGALRPRGRQVRRAVR